MDAEALHLLGVVEAERAIHEVLTIRGGEPHYVVEVRHAWRDSGRYATASGTTLAEALRGVASGLGLAVPPWPTDQRIAEIDAETVEDIAHNGPGHARAVVRSIRRHFAADRAEVLAWLAATTTAPTPPPPGLDEIAAAEGLVVTIEPTTSPHEDRVSIDSRCPRCGAIAGGYCFQTVYRRKEAGADG